MQSTVDPSLVARLDALLTHARATCKALVIRSNYNSCAWTIELKARQRHAEAASLTDCAASAGSLLDGSKKMPQVTCDVKTIAELISLIDTSKSNCFTFTADFRKRGGRVFLAEYVQRDNNWEWQQAKALGNNAAVVLGECLAKAGVLK